MKTRDDRGDRRRGLVRLPGMAVRTAAVQPWQYELAVFCTEVVDAVMSAGGWMCDRARFGWRVTAIVDDPGDVRPLAILGASVMSRQAYLTSMLKRSAPTALAIDSSALYDDRIREHILAALGEDAELTMWGVGAGTGIARRLEPVGHALSEAAVAFKSHALDAIGRPPDSGARVEMFRSCGLWYYPESADLIPQLCMRGEGLVRNR